jgi:hypothetical protein
VKTQWFLSILFASPLCYNKPNSAAAAAGQKSVCGLRYHRSRVRPQISNFIEKKVSRRTEKSSKRNGFSPFFLCCCRFVNAREDKDVAMPLLALQTLAEMKMWRCGGATAGFVL